MDILLPAFALVLVIEGIFPFLSPAGWRATILRVTELRDGQIRFLGLVSMGIGLLLLILAR